MWVSIAADAVPSSTTDPLSQVLQYGILGVVVVVLVAVVRWQNSQNKADRLSSETALQKAHEEQLAGIRDSCQREIKIYQDQISALTEDKKQLSRVNDELTAYVRDKLVPPLVESTRIAADYVAELRRRPPS